MSEMIRMIALQRGMTRLCHFTPSRNFAHIAGDPRGLLSTSRLKTDERAVFNPTDLERLDGYKDHICCSIQYPNAWYFKKARAKERLFTDWVVLFIASHHFWMSGTKFCPRNAAAGGGRGVQEGADAFEALFAPSVLGAGGRIFERQAHRPAFLPTDEQAEVLIQDRVAREDILGIAVIDEAQAKREIARLETLGERVPSVIIAPDFFDPHRQSAAFRAGKLPEEQVYYHGDHDD
ncbi:MAG: DUF4433 domain-containing protein [Thermoanaerobaculia bacterium]|nr:DUF4433 domain-containing protein [Thermoanaerobaculia bacterium]